VLADPIKFSFIYNPDHSFKKLKGHIVRQSYIVFWLMTTTDKLASAAAACVFRRM